MSPADARETRLGLIAALGAFSVWGLTPIYFKWLGQVDAAEIIAHRVVWAVLVLMIVLVLRHRGQLLTRLAIGWPTFLALALSGLLIVINWLIFVHAVNTDRVLSTSLGYFINPLVSVVMGLLFFRERLTPVQAGAVLMAGAGTVYMAIGVGQFPWIALGLAFSFALYAVVRKRLDVGPMVGLFWETLLMAPVALAWLLWLHSQDLLVFSQSAAADRWLLAGTGLVTVIPLLLFAAGVRRLALSTIGLMQYLAPTVTFLLAVFVYNEPFTLDHAITFACIWSALVLFTWSGWHQRRRARIPV
ncbi:MAG: EamA family transporter RarD [Wenzhouxiangella sp.]